MRAFASGQHVIKAVHALGPFGVGGDGLGGRAAAGPTRVRAGR